MKRKNKLKKIVIGIFLVFMVLPVFKGTADYDSRGRRDPFLPLVGGERATTTVGVAGILTIDDVVLQGVVFGAEGNKHAIINGEIMKEGDRIERVSIEKIGDNEVVIKIDEDSYTVKLFE